MIYFHSNHICICTIAHIGVLESQEVHVFQRGQGQQDLYTKISFSTYILYTYLGNEDELLYGFHPLLQLLELQNPVSHPVAHLWDDHMTVT